MQIRWAQPADRGVPQAVRLRPGGQSRRRHLWPGPTRSTPKCRSIDKDSRLNFRLPGSRSQTGQRFSPRPFQNRALERENDAGMNPRRHGSACAMSTYLAAGLAARVWSGTRWPEPAPLGHRLRAQRAPVQRSSAMRRPRQMPSSRLRPSCSMLHTTSRLLFASGLSSGLPVARSIHML